MPLHRRDSRSEISSLSAISVRSTHCFCPRWRVRSHGLRRRHASTSALAKSTKPSSAATSAIRSHGSWRSIASAVSHCAGRLCRNPVMTSDCRDMVCVMVPSLSEWERAGQQIACRASARPQGARKERCGRFELTAAALTSPRRVGRAMQLQPTSVADAAIDGRSHEARKTKVRAYLLKRRQWAETEAGAPGATEAAPALRAASRLMSSPQTRLGSRAKMVAASALVTSQPPRAISACSWPGAHPAYPA